MPYHKVTILNNETGEEEVFLARISPSSIRDWLMDRDALRVSGRPDRPPDVDTDTLRMWLPWPGEEGLDFFKRQREQEIAESGGRPFTTVYGARWHGQGATAWLNVRAYLDVDGGYVVSFASSDTRLPTVQKEYTGYEADEIVWAEIEELIAAVSGDREWSSTMVTTYLDTQWFEADTALAEAEIARGFQSMPEGRA